MIEDKLKDGAVVTIDPNKYLTKRQPEVTCVGCSFFDIEEAVCNRPARSYCVEGDDYYVYIKLEKQ